MKQVILTAIFSCCLVLNAQDTTQIKLDSTTVVNKQNFVLKGFQAQEKSGFTFTNLSAANIKQSNFGQDFTYLLGNTAAAVTTSDAGAGVGYTGIRIRGSDATRINVLVNGIPINDAESHGFCVFSNKLYVSLIPKNQVNNDTWFNQYKEVLDEIFN